MATRSRSLRRPMDQRSLAEALSHPGIDPRQHFSLALVDEGDDAVIFDPDYGPLVSVTLQPSGVQVRARVGMQISGDGEGEYFPFIAGDEVGVAIPQGNERADCVIIARLSNARAPFPAGSVGGQDPAKNNFAFSRRRTPFVQENAGPLMHRQAESGAFLSIDAAGVITMRDGQKAALQMSPDLFGYQSGDGKQLLQLDLSGGRFTIQVDDALFTLSSSRASPEVSALAVPGALSISTSSNPAAEHVATTESVVNLIANILNALGAQLLIPPLSTTPLTGASLGALLIRPAQDTTFMPLGITSATVPLTGTLGPLVAAAIAAAFTGATQKPPGVPGQGQLLPGIGCAGLFAG